MKCYITDETKRFAYSEIACETGSAGEMNQIKVYANKQHETFIGMGGALTEASAYTFSKMSSEKQEELLNLYFGDDSINYTFNRLHIQSCDFALGNYAYVEDPEDKELKTFTLERDKKYIIPLVNKAISKNNKMNFLASPWSPPAFMKTNKEMNHGGKLLPEYKKMWADIMAKFVKEYDALGIKVSRLTVQNEPAAVQTWDSCVYSASEEAEFAVDYLKPSLKEAGYPDVKINVWDHNKEIIIDRADEAMNVSGAKDAIDGIAFHWYSGDHFEALKEVRDDYSDKELIFTEGCVEYSRFASDDQVGHAEKYAHDILGDFKNGCNAFMDWNIYLDKQGGPNHVGNFCDAPVMCDTEKDTIDVKLSYYYIGQFSKFIMPGAKRIVSSSFTSDVETVAFLNPNGEKVLVVLNTGDKDVTFTVYDGEVHSDLTSTKHSIMTLIW